MIRRMKVFGGLPLSETEDQQKAIVDVLEDLDKDQAMDRLVCGDVGFGKTGSGVARRSRRRCLRDIRWR